MSEKTILLPYWTSWHGNYVFIALVVVIALLVYGFAAKRAWSVLYGFVSLITIFFAAPDAHEPRSSDLNGILAQIALIATYIAGLYLLIKLAQLLGNKS